MKKHSTANTGQKQAAAGGEQKLQMLIAAHQNGQSPATKLTIGVDLGDRSCCYCVLEDPGVVLERGELVLEKQPLELWFKRLPASVVALEVGTHSPWASRLLEKLGHEVIVANARRVKLISQSSRKNDRLDAEFLARLARADRLLLAPVHHRGEQAQADLLAVRVRAQLVRLRTQMVNTARGLVKSFGQRLRSCDAGHMSRQSAQHLDGAIRPQVEQLLEVVEQLNAKIEESDKKLEQISNERYREETMRLQQVTGVGPITALSFVLTLEDPHRFRHSRDVGCYLGLRPKSQQSGEREPEMRISKEGDIYLRQLLVQCAQCILSKRGPDTDLKRWGLRIAAKGKKKAKKRAVVAVARKLAILLHRLWVSGESYRPQRGKRQPGEVRVAGVAAA